MKAIVEYLLNKQTKSRTCKITLQSSYDEVLKTLDFYKQNELHYPGCRDHFIEWDPKENELWIYDDYRNGLSIKFILNEKKYQLYFNNDKRICKASYHNLKNDDDKFWVTDKKEIQQILDILNKDLN